LLPSGKRDSTDGAGLQTRRLEHFATVLLILSWHLEIIPPELSDFGL
jgi:hypothetical protein